MKIFNVENGVEKVYVQKTDIVMLNYIDKPIPTSIFKKVLTMDDKSNRNGFIEFNQPNELEFFKSLNWLIDYKQLRYLSEEEIERKCQETLKEINELTNKFNSMTNDEKANNQILINRKTLLNYKIQSLQYLLLIKQGHKQVLFPIVPDSDGFSFKGDDNCEYEIRASLDPNKTLLFRKDGKTLSPAAEISRDFFQMGMSIAIMERTNEKGEFSNDYEISNSLTEDNRYFVIEFKTKIHEQKQEFEEKGIRRLVRRVFKRKKK